MPANADLTLEELFVGREASFEVVVTGEMLDRFADLSGDVSAIHMSAESARSRGLPDRVGHGMLAGAFVSQLVGTRLPGNRALLQTVNLKFHRPFFPGDLLRVHGVVGEIHESVRVAVLEVRITRDEELVASAKVQTGVVA